MATCFRTVKLPICMYDTQMTMKSMSCPSRHYFRSDSTSPSLKHKTSRCYLTARTSWLSFKPPYQKYSLSYAAIHKTRLIKLTGVSNVNKTYATESDNNLKFNVKKSEYNKVVPKMTPTSQEKLSCSKSVPSCPVLCPMCHGNIGYFCNDKTINDLISLKPVTITAESATEVRKTETRATEINTENKVEKDEFNKIIPNFEPNNTWPSVKTTSSSTDSQRLILCPMCHRHIVQGLRIAEQRSYRVVPIIANQTKALNFVAEVKQTTGISVTLKSLNADYNKVIPKCPENGPCPSSPPPCPPCQPCPFYPPPCCPPCPCCPPFPCCPPSPCPQCPECPSEPKCPSQSRSPGTQSSSSTCHEK